MIGPILVAALTVFYLEERTDGGRWEQRGCFEADRAPIVQFRTPEEGGCWRVREASYWGKTVWTGPSCGYRMHVLRRVCEEQSSEALSRPTAGLFLVRSLTQPAPRLRAGGLCYEQCSHTFNRINLLVRLIRHNTDARSLCGAVALLWTFNAQTPPQPVPAGAAFCSGLQGCFNSSLTLVVYGGAVEQASSRSLRIYKGPPRSHSEAGLAFCPSGPR